MTTMTTRPATALVAVPGLDRTPWLNLALNAALGVAWWVALFIPKGSQEFLVSGSMAEMGWGLARVVGIVTMACALFRSAYRRWPRLSPLAAPAYLWGGGAAFLATEVGRTGLPFDAGLALVVVGPLIFMVTACYVVLPMTVLTAAALVKLERRQSTRPF